MLQLDLQAGAGAGEVRFHAALGAAHRSGGVGGGKALPVSQQKSLALAPRQFFECAAHQVQGCRAVERGVGAIRLRAWQCIKRIASLVGVMRAELRHAQGAPLDAGEEAIKRRRRGGIGTHARVVNAVVVCWTRKTLRVI